MTQALTETCEAAEKADRARRPVDAVHPPPGRARTLRTWPRLWAVGPAVLAARIEATDGSDSYPVRASRGPADRRRAGGRGRPAGLAAQPV